MRILRLHVENFGKLQNFDLELHEGLNAILQENGWGKSTLAAFIKAMLYGMPASTKRSLDENERKKYLPWQGGAYGGSMEIVCHTGSYRIERFFGAKESADSFALYDLSTNLVSTRYSERIGEELFGIDIDGFTRTSYLSQHAIVAKGDNNSITAKLGDLLDDVDDVGSFDDAMAALEKRRRYYVMTGGRGRVADLEKEIMERRAQIEHLTRTDEVLQQKEAELAEMNGRIRALSQQLDRIRDDLQKAGLARERAALLAQRRKMSEELETLENAKKALHTRLGGNHPTAEELEEKRRLLDGIYEARARVDEISSMRAHTEKNEILKPSFVGMLPKREDIDAMLAANLELQNVAHREAGMSNTAESATARYFAHQAPPTEQEVKALVNSLSTEEVAITARKARQGSGKRTVAIGSLCAAVASFIVAFLLTGIFQMLFFGLAVSLAILSLCLFLKKNKKESTPTESAAQAAAKAMLVRYGLSTEGDLRQRLTELSLLSRQYRESEQAEKQARAARQALRAKKQQLLSELQEKFRAWDIILPPKNDYRDDIEALRRDVARIQRTASESQQILRRKEAALAEQKRLQAELTPFLRRYDPTASMKPAECLERVQEWETEYLRLVRETQQKRAALEHFVAEKGLATATVIERETDVDMLAAKEKGINAELSLLQRKKADLGSHIERLATDADRLPEAEDALRALEEDLAAAKANSATVANTARFLEEAKAGLSTRYLGDMQKSFSKLLKVLMAEEIPEAVMDTSFEVKLREGGKTQSPESLSQGWRDAVAFCTRLSLTEALSAQGEKPIIILDDPFVNLDERRLSAAKRLLVALSNKYQILYLVCHTERR